MTRWPFFCQNLEKLSSNKSIPCGLSRFFVIYKYIHIILNFLFLKCLSNQHVRRNACFFRFSWVMSNTYKFLRLKPCLLISCTLRFSLFAKLPWGQPGQEGTTQKHGRLFQTLDIFSFDIFNAFCTPFSKPIWTSKVSYGGRAGKRSFRCFWWAAWREVHSVFGPDKETLKQMNDEVDDGVI